MVAALPFDVEDLYDAGFALVWLVVGFLGAGVIGAVAAFLAAYAYIEVTDRLHDTERMVNYLRDENEALRERVDELEAAVDGVGDTSDADAIDHADGSGDPEN